MTPHPTPAIGRINIELLKALIGLPGEIQVPVYFFAKSFNSGQYWAWEGGRCWKPEDVFYLAVCIHVWA